MRGWRISVETLAHRGAYDVVTCRAVARLSVVAEYCVPLLEDWWVGHRHEGSVGTRGASEGDRAADALGAKVAGTTRVPMLPEVGEKERNLVILEKIQGDPGTDIPEGRASWPRGR